MSPPIEDPVRFYVPSLDARLPSDGRVAPLHEVPDYAFAAEVILHVSRALGDCSDGLSGPQRIASVVWWIRTGGGNAQVSASTAG